MPRDPHDDQRLNEGLLRLKELGYLRSPAELFVAEKVSPRAGLLRTSLISGAWIGVGGGILAGLVLAISVLVAVPDLLSTPGDLLHLSLDLILVSAVCAGLFVTLLTLVLLAWKRRRSMPWGISTERGLLLVAVLPPALYLGDVFGRFLLHRVHGPLWYLAAMIAAMIAVLLAAAWGRMLRALLAAAGLAPTGGGSATSLRGLRLQIGTLVLVLTAALLLVGPYQQMRALPRLDQVPVPPALGPGSAQLVITVDGVAASTLLENTERLSVFHEFEDRALPEHPAAFWNNLATGFGAQTHGLQSASDYAPAGVSGGLEEAMGQPVLALVLRVILPGLGLAEVRAHDQRELIRPPYWEIAAHCETRMSSINAWASYPAAQHPGLSVLSDRCFLRMWEGERVEDDPHLTHPLREDVLQEAQAALSRRTSYPAVSRGDSVLSTLALAGLEDFREAWEFAVAADLFHSAMARDDLPGNKFSCVSVHLGGADILRRAADRTPRGAAIRICERLISLHEQFLGQLVDELILEAAGREWTVVSSLLTATTRQASLFSSTPLDSRSVLEFAPQLLWRLGLLPARDMQIETLGLPQERRLPETWGRRAGWTPVAERSAADLERLKSLGYIGGS